MHPIAVHAVAITRTEQLHRDAASWRRLRGARLRSVPAGTRPRITRPRITRPSEGGSR